jgi:hypothetical protein
MARQAGYPPAQFDLAPDERDYRVRQPEGQLISPVVVSLLKWLVFS